MNKIIYILIFFISLTSVEGQNFSAIDSLLSQLEKTNKPKEKIDILNQLAVYSIDVNVGISIKYSEQALSLTQKVKYLYGKAISLSHLGRAYFYTKGYDTALVFINSSLKIFEELDNKLGIISENNHLGIIYLKEEKFSIALAHFLKSLKIAEEINSKEDQLKIINNLGLLYLEIEEYERSIEFINKAIKLSSKLNDQCKGTSHANLAEYYKARGMLKKAIDEFKIALSIFTNLGHIENCLSIHNSIADVYFKLGKYQRSVDNSLVALNYSENIGIDNSKRLTYLNLGKAYFKLKDFKKSREFLNKGLNLSRKFSTYKLSMETYSFLASLDSAEMNFKSAFEHFHKYNRFKDSLYNLERHKIFSETQTKFEIKKKDNENKLLKEKQEINTERIEFQKTINIFLILLIVISIAFIAKVIQGNIKIKKINSILNYKNNIINNKNNELENQREEIESQNNSLEWQNTRLIEHEKLITSSIKYALKIQMAVLPDRNFMDNFFSKYFILFKPLQIVSGDFYWVKEINNKIVFAVADCTGHGVPGAFLSMLGISKLYEVVNKYESLSANQILERLRIEIKKALKQNDEQKKAEDGLDICLCVFDTVNNSVQYSGAYRSLYLTIENANSERIESFANSKNFVISQGLSHSLIELKPDRQPIGSFFRERPFTNHEFIVEKGDGLYLFSDGYYDQFSDNLNEKFTTKRFKELILSMQKMSMPSQKKMLKNSFDKWIGNSLQTDDVLVCGLKIDS